MTDLETLARHLKNLQMQYEVNNKVINETRTRNEQVVLEVKHIYETIKQTPIQLNALPDTDLAKGEKCWICPRNAVYRCFWCFVAGKPCGYCDNHTNKHKIEFPDHQAIFQRIFQLEKPAWTSTPQKARMTPEQELEYWQKKLEGLNNV